MTNRDLKRVFILSNITVVKTLILKLKTNIPIDEVDMTNLIQMESELKEVYLYFKSTLDTTEENKYLDIIERLLKENQALKSDKKYFEVLKQNQLLHKRVAELEITNKNLIDGL